MPKHHALGFSVMFPLASEHPGDEDELGREDTPPAHHAREPLPDELDTRIALARAELAFLLAKKRGDDEAANKHGREMVRLNKLVDQTEGKRQDDDEEDDSDA